MNPIIVDGIELEIASYQIFGTGLLDRVVIDLVGNPENVVRWAIRQAGFCLNRKGDWEYEPIPSSRTEAFFKRCRFNTLEDAVAAWKRAGCKGRLTGC